MSRHRNVRSLNYSDEYDGYDDEYGQSVEDDYCISPSDAAQFMYDRNRQSTQISAFFDEADNIAEENEAEESTGQVRRSSDTFQKPALSELEEVRLQSCLDEIRNVIGDTIPENIIIETILKNSFDLSKSLDAVLSYEPSVSKSVTDEPKPQRERKERNRDDDFSDFYPCVQSNLTGNQEFTNFTIHCKTHKSQHKCLDADFFMLNHLAIDSANLSSDYNMKQNNLPKGVSLTVNDRTEKFGNPNSISGVTDTSENCGMLKINSDSSDKMKIANSCPMPQLKFQIPRLQKVRKDSDKENIAEGDDSDSDEIAFSSLAALAKQYSSKNIVPSEKESDVIEISQTEILREATTVPSLRTCGMTSDLFIDRNRHEAGCNELLKCHSESFASTDIPDSPIIDMLPYKPSHKRHSKNERYLFTGNAELTSENGVTERFSKLSTQNADESSGTPETPVIFNLSESENKSPFPMDSNLPCLRKVKSSDITTTSPGNQNLSSLSEIFKDHLVYKSSKYSDSSHAISNYDVMKSESCPQFVIPRLHIAQKRRGVSESLSDGGKDVTISSTDGETADEADETDNWVIDLKCALKNTQREGIRDSDVVDYPMQDKRFPIELSAEDHLFVPDLPCSLDASDELREDYSQSRREPSAFGKVLCRKWRVHRVKNVRKKRQTSGNISRFTFNTPSPDDIILTYLRLK